MSNPRVRLAAFAAIAAVLPAAAAADNAKPVPATKAASETVVVTGAKPTREERNRIVWNFVYAHARTTPKIDQLARWIVPVCPVVQNLPAGYGDYIVKRIREVAKTAGAPVADSCRPNVEIVFTSDPQAYLDGVARKAPKLLGYHFIHDLGKAATVTRPIQAWYATATTNTVVTALDDPYHPPPGGATGSRLGHGLISEFDKFLIVVDAGKIAGYPVGQVADYIAMQSLTQADAPGDCTELPSILDLTVPGCAPQDALTQPDKSYLAGLYAMGPDEIGSLQKSSIANTMRQGIDTK